jgi:hypothetical protein
VEHPTFWGKYDLSFDLSEPEAWLIDLTCQMLTWTSSTPGISHWARRQTKSPRSCARFSTLRFRSRRNKIRRKESGGIQQPSGVLPGERVKSQSANF